MALTDPEMMMFAARYSVRLEETKRAAAAIVRENDQKTAEGAEAILLLPWDSEEVSRDTWTQAAAIMRAYDDVNNARAAQLAVRENENYAGAISFLNEVFGEPE